MMKAVTHWKHQRLTALINIPLLLWLGCTAAQNIGGSHGTLIIWLTDPVNATLMNLAMLSVSYHAFLGTENVVEDYVHHAAIKKLSKTALALLFFSLWLISFVSIIKICAGA